MSVTSAPAPAARWTRPLALAGREHGGKAFHLAAMLAAGHDVPDGFVIEREAGSAWRRDGRRVPADLLADVVAAWRSLGSPPVAVRSSAVGEDGDQASFAGQFETVLDVRDVDGLVAAMERCWASAEAPRVAAYEANLGAEDGGLALLVQRMVPARAAGVAFTADPLTGDRDVVLVSAVPGLGEALVSGQAQGDDWRVEAGTARRVAGAGSVLSPADIEAVAALARRVEAHTGRPQDIEWAFEGERLMLLQARPMTALPEPVRWDSPVPEALSRNLRLGEWLGDPVTPLFADWLLPRIEDRLHRFTLEEYGMELPRPAHCVVNGWYYYRVPGMPQGAAHVARIVWRSLVALVRDPYKTMGYEPATAHLGLDRNAEIWRLEVWPAYQAAVAKARQQIPTAAPEALPALVDEVADRAGDHFVNMLAVAGTAAKTEGPLRAFWRQHLAGRVEGDPLELLRGYPPPDGAAEHAIQGLDWSLPTLAELGLEAPAPPTEALAGRREALAGACRQELAGAPRLLRRFERALDVATRAHRLREEQATAFTLGWPVLRAMVRRLAEALVARGALAASDDVWWLTRAELEAGLAGAAPPPATLAGRRAAWRSARGLRPPLVIGKLPPHWLKAAELTRGGPDDDAPAPPGAIVGQPASPGRARGVARVLHSLDDLDRLQPGEVLVTRCTTPGWAPAFARAGAVVTDSGSLFSHAAVVAREYGVPAVVACGDATSRLRDGQHVVVDGSRGWVEPQA